MTSRDPNTPVAWATNGYGKISLYWREGIAIDFIPNGETIGLYAAPPQDALDAKRLDALISAVSSGEKDITICPPGNHGGLPDTWLLTIGGNDANVDEWEGTTLRAAIDAAIASEGNKHE